MVSFIHSNTSFTRAYAFIIAGLLSLVLTITPSQGIAKGGWGATPLSEKHRPKRTWIKKFSLTPDVVADGDIDDAISACDNVVGTGKYCVVEITNTSIGLPLEISRSKTKLIASADMSPPLTTTENEIYIYIGSNTKEVIIENLNLEGHAAENDEIFAIFIEGKNIQRILIKNNIINNFDSNSNAHGVAIYGTGKNKKQAIRDIIIEGNNISNMRTGSSETIVVNGNVMHWEIKNNTIDTVNNIAIDAIGGEGTSATRLRRGRILPGRMDAAHHGFIEGNLVKNVSIAGNPSYAGEEDMWVGAIYIDGAHHVKIANNTVENAPFAYMLGAENCISTKHITMINNSAVGSAYGDLYVGGYAKKSYKRDKSINCNPLSSHDDNEGHGDVKFITVKDNSFNSSTNKEKLVTIEYRTTHAIIAEPTVEAINAIGNGSAKKDSNAIRMQ
ncbi:MAG TPA: hypothetical protein EYG68_06530 [Leucothrix mucor]|nr:hypothetical protein [Leucothrix mucor]